MPAVARSGISEPLVEEDKTGSIVCQQYHPTTAESKGLKKG